MRSKLVKLLKDDHSISLLTNVIVAFFGFITFFILVRTYSTRDFGFWVLYLTPLHFTEMIKIGLIKTSMVRYLAGAKETDRIQIIGSGWILSFIIATIVVAVLIMTILVFPHQIKESSYQMFFYYYPLYAFFSLPSSNAIGILEAGQKFKAIFWLRSLSSGLFLIYVIINYFLPQKSINTVVVSHLIINSIVSVFAIVKGWDGVGYIFSASVEKIKCLLNYGKYSVGTMLGSNLLKSSDTIIIGLSPLGTSAVALYSVPLKLIEIMDIPLRSFVLNAFPKMSRASIRGNNLEVKTLFYQYAGRTTLLFIPGLILCLLFAKYMIYFIGGEQYVESQTAILLFQIFSVYSLLLPIDRFSGITLDAINKPNLNLIKVLVMAAMNIAGDLIAIFMFQSIIGVAVVTVFFTIVGQIIGYQFLRKEINIDYPKIFHEGFYFLSSNLKLFLAKATKQRGNE